MIENNCNNNNYAIFAVLLDREAEYLTLNLFSKILA